MKNQEIQEIQVALGCGMGDNFNPKKLRYGRIAFLADADYDGYSITCLLLTFFYKYYPELIEMGKVYWAMAPLFKVETKKKTYYAYTEEELETVPKGTVTRMKGLGESNPQDFIETIFSPNGRFIQFTIKDAELAAHYFDMLMGENIEERREYIFDNIDFENLES